MRLDPYFQTEYREAIESHGQIVGEVYTLPLSLLREGQTMPQPKFKGVFYTKHAEKRIKERLIDKNFVTQTLLRIRFKAGTTAERLYLTQPNGMYISVGYSDRHDGRRFVDTVIRYGKQRR